ncbi:U1 small nuclear ribonucleoprotein C [Kalmusia sp. IMI 367209]|nr:U1 small nuclear ribonucleoprotein C [Kalmusia sp. IMI 367209]
MFWRHNYSPLATEDTERALKSPIQFSNWLVSRRVRTAIIASLSLLLFCLVFFQYPDIHERVRDFAYNATGSALPTCNCSTVQSSSEALVDVDSNTSLEPPIRWSDFAYVQYVTNPSYLCNSVMIFEALRRHNTKADLLMMYPQQWELPAEIGADPSFETEMLVQARDKWKVKMAPIQVRTFENQKDPTWQDSYTKLLAFNQTQYKRVISIDSDGTVQAHMDELFLLPSAPVAMPRAYWMSDKFFLSSQLIVIEPSEAEWKRVEHAIDHHEGHDYDMDILNKLYGKSSTVIPHRKYDLLSGEFQNSKHENYLGSPNQKWDSKEILEEAKFVHFSDWPMPMPWLEPLEGMLEKNQPECRKTSTEALDCTDREIWLGLRKDFTTRRERICGKTFDAKARPPSGRRSVTHARSTRPWYEPVFERQQSQLDGPAEVARM